GNVKSLSTLAYLSVELGQHGLQLAGVAGAQHPAPEWFQLVEAGLEDYLLHVEQVRRVHGIVAQSEGEQQARQAYVACHFAAQRHRDLRLSGVLMMLARRFSTAGCSGS